MISTKIDSSTGSFSPDSTNDEGRPWRQKRKRASRSRALLKSLKDEEKQKKEKRRTRSYEERTMDHWNCKMADTLPVQPRPSHRQHKGKLTNREQLRTRTLHSNAWTKAFKRSLSKLASATSRDRDFAHKLLAQRVRSQQSTRSHPEFYAKQALTSDLDAVLDKVKSLTASGRYKSRKTVNKLGRLRQKSWAADAEDAHYKADPEDLSEWSNVPREDIYWATDA